MEVDLEKAFGEMERGPQIINRKDIGVILSRTGVGSGWRVMEAGSGSGALTMFLANAVRPGGRVYSHDTRKEHLELARRNLNDAGLSDYVDFIHQDVTLKIEQQNLDLAVLDMPSPWKALEEVEESLGKGGWLVIYTPTYEQMKESVTEIGDKAFREPEVFDSLMREYQVTEKATRPEHTGLVHTSFLVFTRRL